MKLKKGDYIKINPDKNSPYTIIKNLTKPQVGQVEQITNETEHGTRIFIKFTEQFSERLHTGVGQIIKKRIGYNFFTKPKDQPDLPHTTTLQKITKAQYTAHLI